MRGWRWLMTAVVVAAFAAGISCGDILARVGAGRTAAEPRQVTPRGPLNVEEHSLTGLFHEVSPSVVFVTSLAVRRDFFRLNVMEIPQGTGSGFIWDGQGHVVTNYHVVMNGDSFQVTLADQSTWPARAVGGAPDKDLAVLRLEDVPRDRLRPIAIGSSADLRVGQQALAIGNPFGFDQTLTTGIVSALGREIESVARIPIRDVIQTDAAINPGNSGGPLLDSAGRLIGVNTAIFSPSGSSAGIGFAIPVDTVNWVVPDLIAYGRLQRPALGIEPASATITRRLGIDGVLVIGVVRGSGAERAGLQPTVRDRRGAVRLGDIIVAVEGEAVRSAAELRLALERRQPGERVGVTVDRDGRRVELQVELGQGEGE